MLPSLLSCYGVKLRISGNTEQHVMEFQTCARLISPTDHLYITKAILFFSFIQLLPPATVYLYISDCLIRTFVTFFTQEEFWWRQVCAVPLKILTFMSFSH